MSDWPEVVRLASAAHVEWVESQQMRDEASGRVLIPYEEQRRELHQMAHDAFPGEEAPEKKREEKQEDSTHLASSSVPSMSARSYVLGVVETVLRNPTMTHGTRWEVVATTIARIKGMGSFGVARDAGAEVTLPRGGKTRSRFAPHGTRN